MATERKPDQWRVCKTHNLRFNASRGGCVACYRARAKWYADSEKEAPSDDS